MLGGLTFTIKMSRAHHSYPATSCDIRQEMVRQVPVPVVQYIDKPVPRRSLRAVEKVVPFPQVFHEAWGYWMLLGFADLTEEFHGIPPS